jgi:phosphatidylglycerol---prolipoprotein diacylglyceryl transferase
VELAIDWNVDSQLIKGWSTPNLYGLLFVGGMILGYYIIRKMFKSEGVSEKYLDKLLLYVVPATIIGARLGHVFFYGPYHDGFNAKGQFEKGYFDHPMDIFKVWEGGLASHGAAIVILIMLYVYSKKVVHRPMLWILDRIVAPIAIAGCFIRLGNLVNHEIIGIPTNLPWGFNFNHALEEEYLVKGHVVPRHPAQLYEAITYLFSFIVLFRMYWKTNAKLIPGRIFGMFMILIWTARFTIEFVKVGQTTRDDIWALNTGQLLSIPFILIGLYLTFRKVPEKEQLKFDEAVATPLP